MLATVINTLSLLQKLQTGVWVFYEVSYHWANVRSHTLTNGRELAVMPPLTCVDGNFKYI